MSFWWLSPILFAWRSSPYACISLTCSKEHSKPVRQITKSYGADKVRHRVPKRNDGNKTDLRSPSFEALARNSSLTELFKYKPICGYRRHSDISVDKQKQHFLASKTNVPIVTCTDWAISAVARTIILRIICRQSVDISINWLYVYLSAARHAICMCMRIRLSANI